MLGLGQMAARPQYKKPPIIEAVLEFRFDGTLSERDMVRLKERLERNFPSTEEQRNFQVTLGKEAATKQLGVAGYKLTSKNAVDVVLIQQQAFVTSRLAPYEGWEKLIENAKANFAVFEKVVGFKRVVRIGTRFINRIDVPVAKLADKDIGDLLKIKIELPSGIASSKGSYSLAINFVHGDSGMKVLAQVAVGEPVLIEHASVFVDIDCAIDENIPANSGQVWTMVDTMRDAKDDIFEGFLTEEARELFR
jgi:uncharacterized protein (TIGR04255 family)